MLRNHVLALLFFAVLPVVAQAESFSLFSIKKPSEVGKPDNWIMVYIPLSSECAPGEIDFAWGMNSASCIKIPNATIHCVTKARLKTMTGVTGHKAACPTELPPGGKCYVKYITAEELSYVGKDPKKFPIAVRSTKSASTGKCNVAAFIDTGGTVVQLSQINLKGVVHEQGMTSAEVSFRGVDFLGPDGRVASSWPSANTGRQTISADRGSCPLSFSRARQAPWPNFGKPQCPPGM